MPFYHRSRRLNPFYREVKESTEGRSTANTGATLTDDADLQIAVEANSTYMLGGFLMIDTVAGAATQFKCHLILPSGSAFWNFDSISTGAGSLASSVYRYSLTEAADGIGIALIGTDHTTRAFCALRGIVEIGVTAGMFKLQWAQNSASANVTQLRAGSELHLTKLTI